MSMIRTTAAMLAALAIAFPAAAQMKNPTTGKTIERNDFVQLFGKGFTPGLYVAEKDVRLYSAPRDDAQTEAVIRKGTRLRIYKAGHAKSAAKGADWLYLDTLVGAACNKSAVDVEAFKKAALKKGNEIHVSWVMLIRASDMKRQKDIPEAVKSGSGYECKD